MPYLSRTFTEYDRRRLCMILLGFNVLQLFIAMSCFVLGAYISLIINSKAHLIEGYSLKPIGGTLSGCSIAMFLFHCFCAKASNDCGYPSTRHRFENKLLLIILGYIIMSVSLLSVSIVCLVQNSRLEDALSHGLLSAMKLYANDKNRKQDFDDIQMEYKCCGSSNHTDWFKVKWMSEIFIPSENDRKFGRGDYLQSVPFSCCDTSSGEPCFHSHVQFERGSYKYPRHGFFRRGCVEALREVLQESLQTTTILVLVPFFMEFTIAVQTRYLQTSLDDCRRRKDPAGDGVGHLFGTCSSAADLKVDGKARKSLLPHSSEEDSILFINEKTKSSRDFDRIFRKSRKKPRTKKIRRMHYNVCVSNNRLDDAFVETVSKQKKDNKCLQRDNESYEPEKVLQKSKGTKNEPRQRVRQEEIRYTASKTSQERKTLKNTIAENARQIPSGNRMQKTVDTTSESEDDCAKPLVKLRQESDEERTINNEVTRKKEMKRGMKEKDAKFEKRLIKKQSKPVKYK